MRFFCLVVFFSPMVALADPSTPPLATSRASCMALLRKAVCVTDADENMIETANGEGHGTVNCTPGSDADLAQMMSWHDELPEKLRPTFCTLSHIYISDGVGSLEFTDVIAGPRGTPVKGAYVGINKSLFSMTLSTHDIVTWKEQGGVFNSAQGFLKNNPSYPQVFYNLSLKALSSDGLYYVILHELGHVVDAYNGITNHQDSYMDGTQGSQKNWNSLSWAAAGGPLPEAAYFHQDLTCWQGGCGGRTAPVSQSEGLQFYQSLEKSGFVTAYAGFNYLEDFAESWAWYVARNYKQADYQVIVPGQGGVDMNAMFSDSKIIKSKMEFIDHLWTDRNFHWTPVN